MRALITSGIEIATATPDMEVTSMITSAGTCGFRYARRRHSEFTLAGGWLWGSAGIVDRL
jgi:hypothetical protein